MGEEAVYHMEVDEMKKFVAVMNIPSPYRLHLLGEMARQLRERDVEFHCHFMNRGHKDRPTSWLNPKIDFPHTYWRNFGPDQHEFNPGLILKLMFEKPDWLLLGGVFDTFTNIFLSMLAPAKTKICWLEGNTKTPGRLDGALGKFKRALMGRCQFAAVPSSDAAKYIGLHQQRTKKAMPKPVYLPNLVDEGRFQGRKVEKLKSFKVEKFQGVKVEGFQGERVCIIPARLEAVKGLVPFFGLLTPEMLKGWKIRVMGQGPLKDEILAMIARRGIGDFVEIVDYVPYEEMPEEYAKSDLLLLPSIYDPNPLSVIEALHSGLAVAVSDQAGNVEEAVSEGRNGWVLPVKDGAAYEAKLREVFATPIERLREMGSVSKAENARFWDTKAAIGRFLERLKG